MEKAQLKPGRGFAPAQSFAYYAQRVINAPWLRQGIVAGLKAGVHARQGRHNQLQPETATQSRLQQELGESGIIALPALLEQRQVVDIHAFLRDKLLRDHHNGGRTFTIRDVPEGARMADYSLRDIIDCPHILELANSSSLLRLAADYIGCKPTISALGLRWSFPSIATGTGLQAFHRDSDDWRFIKVFVYLTDVNADSGPHVYARGSHRIKAPMRLRPYSDEEVESQFGKDGIITVTGPSGFGFAADTYGVHKGKVPATRPRLLLQIQYSLLPVYAYRYQPEPYSGALNLDPYINRLIVR